MKLIALIMMLVVSVGVHAEGPFGLSMGDKLDTLDIKEKFSDFRVELETVPNPNASFDTYIVYGTVNVGLCSIKAISKEFDTNAYGTTIRTRFDSLEDKLKTVYGNNTEYKFLKSGSIWKERNEWTMSLRLKERYYTSFWNEESNSTLKNSIVTINLDAKAMRRKGYITLTYEFENNGACTEENNKASSESL